MRSAVLAALAPAFAACTVFLPLDGLTGGDGGGDAPADSPADSPAHADAAPDSGGDTQPPPVDGATEHADGSPCAHDCGGGACVAGVCQPFTIATGQSAPRDLVVSGSTVYWTTHVATGVVASCPVSGCTGAPQVYFANLAQGAGIAVAGTTLLFGAYGTSPTDGGSLDPGAGVFACSTSGCAMNPTQLAPGSAAVVGVTTDGTAVYWNDNGHGQVFSCALGGCGGNPTVVAGGVGGPWYGIATDASKVYFVARSDGAVYSCPKAGCAGAAPATIATGVAGPFDLAIDATSVYFTSYDPNNPGNPGQVLRCPLAGCSGAPTVIASGQSTPQGIAVDSANVYWTDYANGAGASGTIAYCPKTGCPGGPGTLASAQQGPWLLALDSGFVYWTNTVSGEVMRVAKP